MVVLEQSGSKSRAEPGWEQFGQSEEQTESRLTAGWSRFGVQWSMFGAGWEQVMSRDGSKADSRLGAGLKQVDSRLERAGSRLIAG